MDTPLCRAYNYEFISYHFSVISSCYPKVFHASKDNPHDISISIRVSSSSIIDKNIRWTIQIYLNKTKDPDLDSVNNIFTIRLRSGAKPGKISCPS